MVGALAGHCWDAQQRRRRRDDVDVSFKVISDDIGGGHKKC